MSAKFDILFVCGIAPWLAGALFYIVTIADQHFGNQFFPQQGLATVFIIASLLIGESHQFTSIIRYYTTFRKRDRRFIKERIPFWIIYSSLTVLSIVTILHQQGRLSGPLLLLELIFIPAVLAFPAVLFQHVCAQAVSIAQIYCRMANYAVAPHEKTALSSLFCFLTLTGGCSIAIPFGWESLVELFALPQHPVQQHLLSFFFASAALISGYILLRNVIKRGFTTGEWPPITATLLLTNLTIFTLLPLIQPNAIYVFLFVPLLFHATQHWALAWHSHMKETQTDTTTTQNTWHKFYEFALPILSITFGILFLPLIMRHLSSPISPLQFGLGSNTLSVLFSMLVFYLHYFADRVVWRAKNLEAK